MNKITAVLLTMVVLLSACNPLPITAAPSGAAVWHYADLRVLDPVDAPDPASDLVAAYARFTQQDFEIRLDLLDYAQLSEADFSIHIQFPGGRTWVIVAPQDGKPTLTSPGFDAPGIQPRLIHDLELDAVILRLNRALIPYPLQNARISAFVSLHGVVVDEIPGFSMNSTPPARAPLLLAFWNALPAATPAQALRRWDGAHSGPLGQRHGLSILLAASQQYHVPLALLDLKSPSSLAALHLLAPDLDLSSMEKRGQLILPLTTRGDPGASAVSLAYSRQATLANGYFAPDLIYGMIPMDEAARHVAAFAHLPDRAHLAVWQESLLIPLPDENSSPDLTAYGLPLQAKKDLLQTALSADPSDLLVWGGSLPASTWGDSQMAPLAVRWLADHPWVQMLTLADLTQLAPLTLTEFNCPDLHCSTGLQSPDSDGRSGLREAISQMKAGSFQDHTWQAYFTLTAPTNNTDLLQMQSAALEQIYYFIAADAWQQNPRDISDCSNDLDGDGQMECILASLAWFNILELDGGRLAFSARLTSNGLNQVIGPTSQLVLGMGEPSEWRPERGPAADPLVIPGAMADGTFPWAIYEPTALANEIQLRHPDGAIQKSVRISDESLILSSSDGSVVVPLILSAAIQSASNPVISGVTSSALSVSLADALTLNLSADGLLAASSYDSRALLNQREDPNTSYPPGHYLPFPLIRVEASGSLTLTPAH